MNDRLRDLIQTAREREREAMALRREGLSYGAIGKRFGVTRERVRQIVAKGERIERFAILDERRGMQHG